MKALKYIGIGLGSLIVIVLIVTVLQSPQSHLEKSVVINAEPAAIFPYINSIKKTDEWSPWAKMDPDMTVTYEGPEEGVGAKSTWISEQMGNGAQWITESEPNKRVKAALQFEGFEGEYYGEFVLEPAEGGTKVTWHYYGDVSNAGASGALMGKFFSMFNDAMMGSQFEQGLNDLKTLAETNPAPQEPQEEIPADTTAVQPQ